MKPYYEHAGITIYHGDCREVLPSLEGGSVNCCVTSPPYWGLRDYGNTDQVGLEPTPERYTEILALIFSDVLCCLRSDGVMFLNIGDVYHNGDKGGYARSRVTATDSLQASNLGANFIGAPNRNPHPSLKPKDLVGVPWMVAFALRSSGWWLRSEIIWRKLAPMPESVLDRPTRGHEQVFLMTKGERYFYNWQEARDPLKASSVARLGQDVESQEGSVRANGGAKTNGNMKAARFGGAQKHEKSQTRLASGNEWKQDPEDGANWRDVWDIGHDGYDGDHNAVMPSELANRCIRAGTQQGHIVLDPFMGTGTTIERARAHFCRAIGIEIEEKYCEIAAKRLSQEVFEFSAPLDPPSQ